MTEIRQIKAGDRFHRNDTGGSQSGPFVWDIEDGIVELRSYETEDPTIYRVSLADLFAKWALIRPNLDPRATVLWAAPKVTVN